MGSMAIGAVEFKSFFLLGRHWDPGTGASGGDGECYYVSLEP